MATNQITPKFAIGDKVTRAAFVDCFSNFEGEVSGLTVTEVRLIEPLPAGDMKPYYRVKAEGSGYYRSIEAAEHFFVARAEVL